MWSRIQRFLFTMKHPEQFANSRKVIISQTNHSYPRIQSKPVSYMAWHINMTILKGEWEPIPWFYLETATIFVTRTGFLSGKIYHGYQNRFAPVPTVSQSKPSMSDQILLNIPGSNHNDYQKLPYINHIWLQPWLSEPVWVRYMYLAATTTATRTGFLTFLRLGWSKRVETTPSRIPDTSK